MRLTSQLTGIATLVIVGVAFILADIWLLLVLTPWVLLRPASRTRILGDFGHGVVRFLLGVLHRVGGATVDIRATVPSGPGVMMVMNHQSIIDIPVAVVTVSGGSPRMVAHARYGRGIPLVSHMISLYGHILVQPGRTGRQELDALAGTARASTLPILIFPEGHRTRDGEIRPWKRAGLDTFLSARDWEVYVLVVDGLWRVARLTDFLRNLSGVRCRVELAGVFHYDGRGRDNHDEFVDGLRRAMCDKLSQMRAEARTSTASEERAVRTAVNPRE